MTAPVEVVLVVAVACGGVIGRDGTLPWHLPADLQHFKRLTLGHAVIMGRATFESIGKPLPQRLNIVLTQRRDFAPPGVLVAADLPAAYALAAAHGGPAMVIGGAKVYAQALADAQRIELTEVHARLAGDTHFPPLGPDWRETAREDHPADARNPYPYSFVTYRRG
ncbi:dihydrofolate reductase [Immundisolibacter sp.]|uniref:dihydrofolate reductase n=1 Tax=Immundisolibacter sp. TaxID=1934948 RepID=UPI002610A6B6|nr:dihydrofolate reductase [Immundisolibacter sp.]MDD3650483.1 dihydrofolate reductase [Immundisolibacter sp.]